MALLLLLLFLLLLSTLAVSEQLEVFCTNFSAGVLLLEENKCLVINSEPRNFSASNCEPQSDDNGTETWSIVGRLAILNSKATTDGVESLTVDPGLLFWVGGQSPTGPTANLSSWYWIYDNVSLADPIGKEPEGWGWIVSGQNGPGSCLAYERKATAPQHQMTTAPCDIELSQICEYTDPGNCIKGMYQPGQDGLLVDYETNSSYVESGHTAIARCKEHFEPVFGAHQVQVQCLDGSWISDEFACTPITCPDLFNMTRASVVPEDGQYFAGRNYTHQCLGGSLAYHNGENLTSSATYACHDNKTWTPEIVSDDLYCIGTCEAIPSVANGLITGAVDPEMPYGRPLAGTEANMTCSAGLSMNGRTELLPVCQQEGYWYPGISASCSSSMEFRKVMTDHRFGPEFAEMINHRSVLDCGLECVLMEGCQGFNFEKGKRCGLVGNRWYRSLDEPGVEYAFGSGYFSVRD